MSEYIAGEHDGCERDEWIRRVRPPGEGAMVAGLFVIAEPPAKKLRPSADNAVALLKLARKSTLVVDAKTGVTSEDGEKWDEAVKSAAHNVASGRRLTSMRGKKMRAAQLAVAEPGVVDRWTKDPSMRATRERWAQHWRDTAYSSAEEAFDAMPDEIREEIGSLTTARRIFKHRRPGDPSAGGRPKLKRKTKR